MRKGVLHDTALELDCNKVALGHHKDDCRNFILNITKVVFILLHQLLI